MLRALLWSLVKPKAEDTPRYLNHNRKARLPLSLQERNEKLIILALKIASLNKAEARAPYPFSLIWRDKARALSLSYDILRESLVSEDISLHKRSAES